jgi:cytoskeletal protein RodZ
MSLEEIAAVTKVRASQLAKIEADDLEGLPGGVFLRGFVRAYLDAVHAPAQRALELLDQQVEPVGQAPGFQAMETVHAEQHGGKFKIGHLLVLVFAVLAMLAAYFLSSGDRSVRAAVTSVQSTDVDSGTTRSFSPLHVPQPH